MALADIIGCPGDEPGQGFIISVPKPDLYPTGNSGQEQLMQPVQFVGVPNNGIITTPPVNHYQSNLIGNPYPSAIDADLFMTNPIMLQL